jgi:hypothetical protein
MEGFGGIAAAGLGGVAQVASIASAFWLGARVLRRSLGPGGGLPERLLGMHLIATIGFGSLLLSIASMSSYGGDPLPAAVFVALVVGGNLATIGGLGLALWFSALVFHGGARGPMTLAAASTGSMLAAFAWYVAMGGASTPGAIFGRSYWPLVAAIAVCDVWLAWDALTCRRQLLRRLALGLAEPIVVERMLLWAVASLSRLVLVLMAPITSAVTDLEMRRHAAPWLLTVSGTLILVSCVSLWLMLVPSARYRRWVERRYAGAPAQNV